MRQYKELLKKILAEGTIKPAAREGMIGSQSYFGYQFRHNMVSEGFPILTTKYVNFKNIWVELFWFLRGDTNIKFLIEHGFNMWNEDAYNYYSRVVDMYIEDDYRFKRNKYNDNFINLLIHDICVEGHYRKMVFSEFVTFMKKVTLKELHSGVFTYMGYTIGDTGFQYGKTWRNWESTVTPFDVVKSNFMGTGVIRKKDQIIQVLNSLKDHPESRRHIVSATDPGHDTPMDLALYWCHSFFQFNCRPITYGERLMNYKASIDMKVGHVDKKEFEEWDKTSKKYFLDLQLYQRSADSFLGVPYNISSYALLLSLFAEVLDMIPGHYIHTFGDAHIYDNHRDQAMQQLERFPYTLPKIEFNKDFITYIKWAIADRDDQVIMDPFKDWTFSGEEVSLIGYQSHPAIKGKLSTGLR